MNQASEPNQTDARRRVIIEGVSPEIDGGRHPVKRVVGDRMVVEADFVADGHDVLAGVLRYRHEDEAGFREVPLTPLVNDRFRASFVVSELGRFQYEIEGWVDDFATWRRGFERKVQAGQKVDVDLQVGAGLVRAAVERASGADRERLRSSLDAMTASRGTLDARIEAALAAELAGAMASCPDRSRSTRYGKTLEVVVDRPRARFSAWYEMFPRSCGPSGKHGTFKDAEARLPYIAELGFDVLYLPPIHPIGRTFRKGKNNTLEAGPEDPGSPWAIGAAEGGHKAVHPDLGTIEDFRRFVKKANEHHLEIALDVAFLASPDHPYVEEHPEWFVKRPDGTIQYAENPPKKYQDIYPFYFEGDGWRALWEELLSVFLFWVEQGVRIFRVDNPHTKSLRFWAWCIPEVKRKDPGAIFLSEAFTRPKVMYHLAKLGFTQSYTYFAWRHHPWEFREYLTELTRTEVAEYFRPNFWPNTPDILPEHLQFGGRGAFVARLVLASTLSSNYGIYGPAFELMDHVARPGSEEYIDNEKYELKDWNLADPNSLRHVITRVNRVRRENRALHDNRTLTFHGTDNEQLLCYSKRTEDLSNVVLVVVNLDHHNSQSGHVHLDLAQLGVDPGRPFLVHDQISDSRYQWAGAHNYVELDNYSMPAHVFRVQPHLRAETDFETYG